MRWAILVLASCVGGGHDRELVDVKRDDLVVSVDVSGELAAVDSTDIKTPFIVGIGDYFPISELAPEGSDVKVGDLLATLDGTFVARKLEDLQAVVRQAQTLLEQRREVNAASRRRETLGILQAEANAWRATTATDVPPELVASVELRSRKLDEEQATMAAQQVKLDASDSRRTDDLIMQSLLDDRATAARRVDELTHSLERLTIRSPRAGTVVYARRNEKLKVGESVSDTFMSIVGLDRMAGEGTVDEVDVAKLSASQPVVLRVDALPDARLRGSVESIAASVQPRSGADPSKVVRLTIAIDVARSVPLRPGMRFHGQIETQRVPGALQVPAEAVFVTADGPVVYRETDAGLERVPVQLGMRSTEMIEVKTGLAVGDRVSLVEPEGS